MRVIFCNGKGGTGKTTMSVLLAHALAEAGRDVAVLDMDPQGTATAWLETIDDGKVGLMESSTDYDAVMIDTPPRIDAIRPALASASIVVLVCSPSPADLWTTRDTASAIAPHLPDGAKTRILFNGVRSNTILSRELPDLAQRIGVKALRSTVARRQCYQHAALLGWSALDGTAREELFKAAVELLSE